MADRDDFSPKVRRAVALRAGYQCSFSGCSVITVGPTDESPDGYAQIGMAAHVHAAAPGGKRYVESMTPAQRSHIDNAIWMCGTHGTLIDQDEVTYTPEVLRSMRRSHEKEIAKRMAANRPNTSSSDLIAVGPNIIFSGSVIGSNGSRWSVRIDHFVRGDVSELVTFGERFESLPRRDRFVLVASFGDGRVIRDAPTWTRAPVLAVELNVEPSFPRTPAQDLGEDLKLDLIEEDITADLATVSGVDALPQKIHLCLWHQKGQFPWDQDFGTRLAEYYSLFQGSPWLEQLVKLEVIRMAAIPYPQDSGDETTPFECVERVRSVDLLADKAVDERLPIRVGLEVVGIGTWSSEVLLQIPAYPFPEPPAFPSADDLLKDTFR